MRTVKLTLAYDGTGYQGWQIQKTGLTLEGTVKECLERMHKREISFHAAGRTDSGVHANGQVISFETDLDSLEPRRYCRAINNFFPPDIKARELSFVEDGFHARYDARVRSYKYYILPSDLPLIYSYEHCWRTVRHLDVPRLNDLARVFIGNHDFTTFSSPNDQVPNKQRTIYGASFSLEGPYVVFCISAPSFLWKMVRSIVGSILHFDQQGLGPEVLSEYLAAKDRSLAGPTAPARGLFLDRVVYKNEASLF